MTAELRDLCRLRYGDRWTVSLAKDICRLVPGAQFKPVLRTIQRYAAGDTDPPPVSEAAIRLLTQSRD